jgi:hypothetical protein
MIILICYERKTMFVSWKVILGWLNTQQARECNYRQQLHVAFKRYHFPVWRMTRQIAAPKPTFMVPMLSFVQSNWSDLGPLSYFLGIKVKQSTKEYHLCLSTYKILLLIQASLIIERLQHLWIFTCSFVLLLQMVHRPLEDPSKYRHIVGSLVYLIVIRPDIAHAIHILSQFVCAPTSIHFSHLLRVLWYLGGYHLVVYSMLVIVRCCFMLTRTPLGQLTWPYSS